MTQILSIKDKILISLIILTVFFCARAIRALKKKDHDTALMCVPVLFGLAATIKAVIMISAIIGI